LASTLASLDGDSRALVEQLARGDTLRAAAAAANLSYEQAKRLRRQVQSRLRDFLGGADGDPS
jgi:hypothetical protein